MPRWVAAALVLAIAVLGIVFLGLDILDIAEDVRLVIPVKIADLLISLVLIAVAFFSALNFVRTGRRLQLWLGCGAFILGIGNLIRVALEHAGPNTVITSQEILALMAAWLNIAAWRYTGGGRVSRMSPRRDRWKSLGWYVLAGAGIVVIVLLSSWHVFPSFFTYAENTTLRDTVRGITSFLFALGSIFLLWRFLVTRTGSVLWYSLGLLLFAFGITYLTLAAIDSRLYWLGKVSLLAGAVYLLPVVLEGSTPDINQV